MLAAEEFKKRIEQALDIRLELIVNENKSTMLSVLDKRRGAARLSMHKMFLDAPENVIAAIVEYVRGKYRRKEKDNIIRGYIQSNLGRFNYAHKLKPAKLDSAGKIYDLQAIYNETNEQYFEGKLNLAITWFGTLRPSRSRMIFGQYFDHLKLIKIHRLLDDPFYPEYFVRFVIYHEMLHDVVPGYLDSRGFFRTHGPEFKRREKLFVDYEQADAWEKEHRKHFFR